MDALPGTGPTADDYQWPTCPACHRPMWAAELSRQTCRPCQDKAGQHLTGIRTLFPLLNSAAALMKPGRRTGAGASGSHIPPLPVSLAVLNLAATGGVAARLQVIEDAWRQALGWAITPRTDGQTVFAWWRADPARDVPDRIRFLTDNLLWACDSYPEVAQDLEEIRRIHSEATAALSPDPRPGRVKIGYCPTLTGEKTRCAQPLTATAASTRVRCEACGTRWTTLDDWHALRAAQDHAAAAASRAAGTQPVAA